MKGLLLAALAVLAGLALAWPAGAVAAPHAAGVLVVSPQGPYTSIQAAVDAAQSGDRIEVRPGVYREELLVRKTVTLEGSAGAVIDGGEQNTVVTLEAPDIVFRGFEVRGSGVEPDRDHSGIIAAAPRVVVENNVLRDVLFGIFVSKAEGAVVRGNTVGSKDEYDVARKGDGLRLWYSPNVLIEHNIVKNTRDVVVWYSSGVTLRDNTVSDGRYGVHLMYCDHVLIEGNHMLNNSVGIYTMYSTGTAIHDNLIRGQRGPSGYALGFKDADDIEARNNALIDNRVGIYLDNTPFSPQGFSRFTQNIIAFNDVGVIVQPAVRGNVFEKNVFWENSEQVSVQGGGVLAKNTWQGNYWSDYAGFDADGDDVGDVPYQSQRFFENLADREPRLRALLYSPAVDTIEFAASAFPVVRPQPKLTDPAPAMNIPPLPALLDTAPPSPWPMRLTAASLLALGLAVGWLATRQGGRTTKKRILWTRTQQRARSKSL
ncbi:MAG: nitrous oxide reductase family maturation protein NosD [Anaerolineae bacterium]